MSALTHSSELALFLLKFTLQLQHILPTPDLGTRSIIRDCGPSDASIQEIGVQGFPQQPSSA